MFLKRHTKIFITIISILFFINPTIVNARVNNNQSYNKTLLLGVNDNVDEIEWVDYINPIGGYQLKYPSDWVINYSQADSYNLEITSPVYNSFSSDVNSEAVFKIKIISASQIIDFDKYINSIKNSLSIFDQSITSDGGINKFHLSGVTRQKNNIRIQVFTVGDYIYYLEFSSSFTDGSLYNSYHDLLFSFFEIISPPSLLNRIPEIDNSVSLLESFSFPALKQAFTFGYGKILSGYYGALHTGGDDYALDLCEGEGCSGGSVDDVVLAPTDLKLIYSINADSLAQGVNDFHFFEIDDDGANRLCMTIAHFKLIPGFDINESISRGSIIGYLLPYPTVPHIHMGLYRISNSYSCAYRYNRFAIPYSGLVGDNGYPLDGSNYYIGPDWNNTEVISSNAPLCSVPSSSPANISVINQSSAFVQSDPLDCYPSEIDQTPPSGFFTNPSNSSTIHSRDVSISASASDNSGGSGISEVRFSAKWGGNWYGIGSDSSDPYSLNWDMCNVGVPDGDVELGLEVWDKSNNNYVYSDYYANPHIIKAFTCDPGDPIGSGDVDWTVHLWQNKYLAGDVNAGLTYTWSDGYPYVNLNWGTSGPLGTDWGGDDFSLRMWRNVYFPGGYYSFHADHDDGVKVFVDGSLILNAWWDGHTTHDTGITLSSGWHEVKVEYYENLGDSILKLKWYGAGYPAPDLLAPTGSIITPAINSASNKNPISIYASASDDASGVSRVNFYAYYCTNSDYCSYNLIYTDYSSPYQFDWDWSVIPPQIVTMYINVYDNYGRSTSVAGGSRSFVLDNLSPEVIFINPIDNQHHTNEVIQLSVNATDTVTNHGYSGISSVQFFAGYNDGSPDYWHDIGWGTLIGGNWVSSWDSSIVPEGETFSLYAYAYDKAGNYNGAMVQNNRSGPSLSFLPLIINKSSSAQWVTLTTENFEGSFPQSGWSRYDWGYTGGEYLIGKRNCNVNSGSYNGWLIGGGSNGSLLTCYASYLAGHNTWFIYGPFSTSSASVGVLSYDFYVNSETGWDRFWVMATDDYYGDWWGVYRSGSWPWQTGTLDLNSLSCGGGTKSCLNLPSVYIAFSFDSDSSIQYTYGAMIDNIALKLCFSGSCIGSSSYDVFPPFAESSYSDFLQPFLEPGYNFGSNQIPQ